MTLNKSFSDSYAIVGQSLSLPEASNLDMFWDNLMAGKVSIDEVTPDRWDWKDFYGSAEEDNQKSLCKWASLLPEFRYFDNEFFKVPEQEAPLLDPQIRVLLQLAWQCFEDAGYNPEKLSGQKVGVFIGVCHSDFSVIQKWYKAYSTHGIPRSMLANRISHFFNLTGASLVVDTACSSSLVGLHVAMQSLKNGDCDSFLLGGTNFMPHNMRVTGLSDLGVLSTTGHCKAFDDDADGIIIGEGAALIYVKRTEDAIRDGDHIYGIIKGSTINHGGTARTVTSPNMFAQSALVSEAYQTHNISPDSVVFIEAHGTGTNLGDPIEVNALKRGFMELERKFEVKIPDASIPISSVKPNVGHSEAAAGITGILRILKVFETETVPPLGDFETQNKRVKLDKSPFFISNEATPLKKVDNAPRRAGVSSFGIGGTNVHIILEEPPKAENKLKTTARKKFILPISAKTEASLKGVAGQLAKFIAQKGTKVPLPAIEQALQTGRKAFAHRAALIVKNHEDAINQLTAIAESTHLTSQQGYVLTEPKRETAKLPKKAAMTQIAKVWLEGYTVDWPETTITKTPVPGYVFEQKDFGLGYDGLIGKDCRPTKSAVKATENTSSQWAPQRSAVNGKVLLKSKTEMPSHSLTVNGTTNGAGKTSANSNNVDSVVGASNDVSKSIANGTTNGQENGAKSGISNGIQNGTVNGNGQAKAAPKTTFNLAQITGLMAEILLVSVDKIKAEDTFQDIGLDSITGVEFMNKLNRRLGIKLNTTILYDVTSPAELLAYLNEHHGEAATVNAVPPIKAPANTPTDKRPEVRKAVMPNGNGQHQSSTDQAALLETMAGLLGEVLFCEIRQSDYNKEFHLLGLDSITGVSLINKMNRTYGIKLDATNLYDYTNLNDLAAYLAPLVGQPNSQPVVSPVVQTVPVTSNGQHSHSASDDSIDQLLEQFENDELAIDDIIKKLTD